MDIYLSNDISYLNFLDATDVQNLKTRGIRRAIDKRRQISILRIIILDFKIDMFISYPFDTSEKITDLTGICKAGWDSHPRIFGQK